MGEREICTSSTTRWWSIYLSIYLSFSTFLSSFYSNEAKISFIVSSLSLSLSHSLSLSLSLSFLSFFLICFFIHDVSCVTLSFLSFPHYQNIMVHYLFNLMTGRNILTKSSISYSFDIKDTWFRTCPVFLFVEYVLNNRICASKSSNAYLKNVCLTLKFTGKTTPIEFSFAKIISFWWRVFIRTYFMGFSFGWLVGSYGTSTLLDYSMENQAPPYIYIYIYICACVCVYLYLCMSRMRYEVYFKRSLAGLNSDFSFS